MSIHGNSKGETLIEACAWNADKDRHQQGSRRSEKETGEGWEAEAPLHKCYSGGFSSCEAQCRTHALCRPHVQFSMRAQCIVRVRNVVSMRTLHLQNQQRLRHPDGR